MVLVMPWWKVVVVVVLSLVGLFVVACVFIAWLFSDEATL